LKKQTFYSFLGGIALIVNSGCAIYPYDDYYWEGSATLVIQNRDTWGCSHCGTRLEIELIWDGEQNRCGNPCGRLELELLTPEQNLIPASEGIGGGIVMNQPSPGTYEVRVVNGGDHYEYGTIRIQQRDLEWPYSVYYETEQNITVDPRGISLVYVRVD
jgi:hypothetical protein